MDPDISRSRIMKDRVVVTHEAEVSLDIGDILSQIDIAQVIKHYGAEDILAEIDAKIIVEHCQENHLW